MGVDRAAMFTDIGRIEARRDCLERGAGQLVALDFREVALALGRLGFALGNAASINPSTPIFLTGLASGGGRRIAWRSGYAVARCDQMPCALPSDR